MNILKSAAAQTAIENSSNQNLINSNVNLSSNHIDFNNNSVKRSNNNENYQKVNSGNVGSAQQHHHHQSRAEAQQVATAAAATSAADAVDYDLKQFQNDFSDLVKSNMKLIFEQFDKDNDGRITKHELNFVMCNLFPDETITEQDIDDMLRAADLDNNGFIDFEGICVPKD